MQQSEEKRADKLRTLLHRQENNETVQNRQLKTWLSVEGYARYEELRQEQRDLKEYLRDIPPELIKYREGLQKLKFNYSKANDWSLKGSKAAKGAFDKCQSEAENLAVHLHESLQANPSLYEWFPNDPLSEINTASPSSFPDLVTSRTTSDSNPKLGMTIREVKILAIELELSELESPVNTDDPINPFNIDFYSSVF